VRPEQLSFRQVRYFVEVATSGSLTAASRALRVSQPAVGQQVRQLEETLGFELFDRHSRGVRLSAEGRKWLPHARRILAAVEEAGAEAERLALPGCLTLRLGVTPSVARSVLPPLLYRSTLPEAKVRFDFTEGMSEDLLSQVESGALDIAFGYRPSPAARITSIALAVEALCVVGPLARIGSGAAPFPATRLATLPLVLGRRPNAIRDRVEAAVAARGRSIGPVMELDLAGLKRDFLLGRDYCAVSPRGLFLSDIREGRLGSRPIDAPQTRQTLYLLAREGLPARSLDAARRAVTQVVETDISRAELCWDAPPPSSTDQGRAGLCL
jgi:LysR family nitrogen assimilation transcriptional regulator